MKKTLAALALIGSATALSAAPVTPTGTFGDLQTATTGTVSFTGSGIPTAGAAISSGSVSTAAFAFGILATPRYSSPGYVANGDGTFDALTGDSTGGTPVGATWNFSFYAEIFDSATTDPLTIDDMGLQLYYDFDPGAATDIADHGVIDLSAFIAAFAPGSPAVEGSQNPTFGFLGTSAGSITAPPLAFDRFAEGEYTFSMRSSLTGTEASILVNVANAAPIPLPAGLPLLLAGLGGLALMRRRG